MAILHADLTTTTTTPGPFEAAGTSLRGYLTTTYRRLREVFGEDDHARLPERAACWTISTPVDRVTLCPGTEYLDPRQRPDTELRWHIGGYDDRALPWLAKVICGSTADFPAGAREFFADATLAAFTAAYVDYLYLRTQAAERWLSRQDRRGSAWRDNQYLPWQLNVAARAVRQALFHYQWSQASPAERHAWATMARPQPGYAQTDLEHWHALGRWLYSPIPTPQVPEGGDADLAGMLLGLANRHVRHRARLREINPALRLDAYDEHEATLRALASTPVPGLDSLRAGGLR